MTSLRDRLPVIAVIVDVTDARALERFRESTPGETGEIAYRLVLHVAKTTGARFVVAMMSPASGGFAAVPLFSQDWIVLFQRLLRDIGTAGDVLLLCNLDPQTETQIAADRQLAGEIAGHA